MLKLKIRIGSVEWILWISLMCTDHCSKLLQICSLIPEKNRLQMNHRLGCVISCDLNLAVHFVGSTLAASRWKRRRTTCFQRCRWKEENVLCRRTRCCSAAPGSVPNTSAYAPAETTSRARWRCAETAFESFDHRPSETYAVNRGRSRTVKHAGFPEAPVLTG